MTVWIYQAAREHDYLLFCEIVPAGSVRPPSRGGPGRRFRDGLLLRV
jgi:hypothetical protein